MAKVRIADFSLCSSSMTIRSQKFLLFLGSASFNSKYEIKNVLFVIYVCCCQILCDIMSANSLGPDLFFNRNVYFGVVYANEMQLTVHMLRGVGEAGDGRKFEEGFDLPICYQ